MAFERDGFVIERAAVGGDDVAALRAEADALLQRTELLDTNNLRVRYQPHVDTYEMLFELFDPVLDIAPSLDGVVRSLRGLAADLLGDDVEVIKDKLIYKQPGSGGYPLHQDFIAWPGFPETFTTCVIALDDASEENGWIEVFPGLHKSGVLAERDGNFHILDDDQVSSVKPVALDLRAGDVALFGCFMPHRSAPNRSRSARRHALVSYHSVRDGRGLRDEHYRVFHHWLRTIYGGMGMADMFFK
jgi:hypothetical protein